MIDYKTPEDEFLDNLNQHVSQLVKFPYFYAIAFVWASVHLDSKIFLMQNKLY